MGLRELHSPSELRDFIAHAGHEDLSQMVVVTFSAHWCGPCRQSKPALEECATKYSHKQPPIPMGIVYEDVMGNALHDYQIRAFPTHVVFLSGQVYQRVEGANIPALEQLIQTSLFIAAAKTMGQKMRSGTMMAAEGGSASFTGSGETIGTASGANNPKTAEEMRQLRLQTLAGKRESTTQPDETNVEAKQTPPAPAPEDVVMTDAPDATVNTSPPAAAAAAAAAAAVATSSPDDATAAMETLTQSMGFTEVRAQKGLKFGGGTLEGAIEWLLKHQDDADIDDPMDEEGRKGKHGGDNDDDDDRKPSAVPDDDAMKDDENHACSEDDASGGKAMSYRCNDCGKILSNMANLELHANKTGHSDFEESTVLVKPLTEEEKAAKIAEIKDLLKAKRTEREEKEKDEQLEREKQRRFMGKEMAKTKEQMEMEARKREAMLRKKEKEAFKKERARLRAELAKDKAERLANAGKLSSKLGVEGYHPDAIQYDVPPEEAEPGSPAAALLHAPKKPKADAGKIDEYIKRIASYKAGGDGGKCLKVLKAYVGNVADHPEEEKYKSINMNNNVYKTKVKPFVGAKSLLLAVGFHEPETGEALVLVEHPNLQLLADTKAKLEAALASY